MLFFTGLPTRQDGVENRDKAKNSTVEVSDGIRERFFAATVRLFGLFAFRWTKSRRQAAIHC